MKRTFQLNGKCVFCVLCILSTFIMLQGADFQGLMKKAADTQTLADRYKIWDEALSAAKNDSERFQVASTAFAAAFGTKDKDNVGKYGFLIAGNPTAPAEERANAMFHALKMSNEWKNHTLYLDLKIPPSFWEAYLKMPEKKPEQEVAAFQELAEAYKRDQEYVKAIMQLRRVLDHPAANVYDKINVSMKLSDMLLETGKQKEALDCLEKAIALPGVPPGRKVDLMIKKSDVILAGNNYYATPSQADLDAACKVYQDIIDMKGVPRDKRDDATIKLANFHLDRKNYEKAFQVASKLLKAKRNPPSQWAWNQLSIIVGHAQTGMKNYEGAIETFDKLRDLNYMIGDTCRFLGFAYYKNKDYTLALGSYDMALEALKRAEDDRPLWCKSWISKIKWFTNERNAKSLNEIMAKRAAKLEAAAKASGKQLQENVASSFKSASDGVSDPANAVKKKKAEILDIDDIISGKGDDNGISADGLELDDDTLLQ